MTKRRARWLQLTHEIFTHPWLTDLVPAPHQHHTATYPHDLSEVFAGMDKGREEQSSNPASPSIRYRGTQCRTHSPDTPSDSAIRAYNHPNRVRLNDQPPGMNSQTGITARHKNLRKIAGCKHTTTSPEPLPSINPQLPPTP